MNIKQKITALLTAAVFSLTATLSHSQVVANLDDLHYWGSGTNRIGFVAYWDDSKTPNGLAWGYKWSGTKTVADMLLDLAAAADSRLFLRIDSSTPFGLALFGVGYQTGNATFGVSGAKDPAGNPVTPIFTSGVDDLNTSLSTEAPSSSISANPANSVDRYQEGWLDNGYWELFHSGNSSTTLDPSYTFPTTWTSSWVGSSLTLVNDAWVAYTKSKPDYSPNSPTTDVVAAVPEPGSVVLILLGLGALAHRRRR